jgi:hypothetical protein
LTASQTAKLKCPSSSSSTGGSHIVTDDHRHDSVGASVSVLASSYVTKTDIVSKPYASDELLPVLCHSTTLTPEQKVKSACPSSTVPDTVIPDENVGNN